MESTNRSVDETRIKALVLAVLAIEESIKGLGSVPSGHLYANLMDKMSLDTYEGLLSMVLRRGNVRKESNHLLVWCGRQA